LTSDKGRGVMVAMMACTSAIYRHSLRRRAIQTSSAAQVRVSETASGRSEVMP
jgi:hypothetical protein